MNTQKTTPEKGPVVVDMLESAESDLEQFRKEIGHDQTKVHDRYEQLKQEIKEAIRQMKDMIHDNKALAKDIAEALQLKLQQLEEQVMTPRQESQSELLTQLTNIKRVMEEIVKYLAKVSFYDLTLSRLHDRIFRYKIKLGIIKLKLQLGTMQMKDTVMDARFDLKKKIHNLRDYVARSENGLEKRWNVFHTEINQAYEHLQKAFTSK